VRGGKVPRSLFEGPPFAKKIKVLDENLGKGRSKRTEEEVTLSIPKKKKKKVS